MQPQNSPTGHEQQLAPQNGIPATPLKEGEVPTISDAKSPDERAMEQWAQQVQKVIADTAQSPRARADALRELKARYQQQVLGLGPKAGEN